MFGLGTHLGSDAVTYQPDSVELGLREMSPKGSEGGFAIPASGCSSGCDHAPDPVITVDKPIVRYGDSVKIHWNPKTNTGCQLSENVNVLVGGLNPTTTPNAMAVGSRIDLPEGESIYTITCNRSGHTDSATVKVLPRIQET